MQNPKLASLTFNPHGQNLDHVNLALKNILNRIGCGTCGRLLTLEAGFQGDPPDAELGKANVINVAIE
jgi:hypothetical protein